MSSRRTPGTIIGLLLSEATFALSLATESRSTDTIRRRSLRPGGGQHPLAPPAPITSGMLERMRTKPQTVRLDREAEAAADFLRSAMDGAPFSEIVRVALIETATSYRRAQLRAESAALRNNPADVAEMRQVAADLEALSAW
jgi:hypothetical protein